MIAVLQRVTTGKVKIGGLVTGSIDNGLVILLGVHRDDKDEDINFLVDKILGLRIFNDCLLYTSPSPRDRTRSRMPSSA